MNRLKRLNKENAANQQGSILLMAMLILLVLSVLGTSILSIASMENKISSNSVKELKAQEAADAGVEWAIEKIFTEVLLGQIFYGSSLPIVVSTSPILVPQSRTIDSEIIQWTISDCNFSIDQTPNANRYLCTIQSTGNYSNVTKKVSVTIGYGYNFTQTADGLIISRTVNNTPIARGIISYSIQP